MNEKSDKTETATEKGRRGFRPGVSGNPRGRPRGSRNRTTLQLEKILAEHGEDVMEQLLALALRDGDRPALKLCLDRLLPPLKSRPLTFTLPKIKTAEDVIAAYTALFDALAQGQITMEEAATLKDLLESMRRAVETEDLARRMARVEATMGAKP